MSKRDKRRPIELPESFFEDGLISEVLRVVKSGKEATVYCCRAGDSARCDYVAAKVYRPRERRGFKNDSVYQEGRVILDERVRRAFENKTRFGREYQFSAWLYQEFQTLQVLHRAGADVPRPIANDEDVLLMEFLGQEETAAAPLAYSAHSPERASALFRQVIRNLEVMLTCDLIHADLSAFNILWLERESGTGEVRVIDFPQAVSTRTHPSAFQLFQRDVANVCDYFAGQGVRTDPIRLARRLWDQFADHNQRLGSRRDASLVEELARFAGVDGG